MQDLTWRNSACPEVSDFLQGHDSHVISRTEKKEMKKKKKGREVKQRW